MIFFILSMWDFRQEIQVDVQKRELKIWVLNSRDITGLVRDTEDYMCISSSENLCVCSIASVVSDSLQLYGL